MKSARTHYLATRVGRSVRRFVHNSIARSLFIFLFAVLPVLLVASPQWTAESSPRPVAAAANTNQQAQATDFPQLPYQGTPPELSQDRGILGLRLMLRRLGTTARLMQTVAHPDDEDGGMLTLESRGRGASVLLMTLNRGEG
ncbi:MAG: hypothetical protein WAN17_19410, partial [Candidatus Sulfotelmatobacter sp.]